MSSKDGPDPKEVLERAWKAAATGDFVVRDLVDCYCVTCGRWFATSEDQTAFCPPCDPDSSCPPDLRSMRVRIDAQGRACVQGIPVVAVAQTLAAAGIAATQYTYSSLTSEDLLACLQLNKRQKGITPEVSRQLRRLREQNG